jgi:hypothetical protein
MLVATLNDRMQRRGEDVLDCCRRGGKGGHERVYAMDDHTADESADDAAEEAAYGDALMKAWDNPAYGQRKRIGAALQAALTTPAAVLAMYHAYNAPDQAEMVFRSDFGAALEEPSPRHFGRNTWPTGNAQLAHGVEYP